MHLAWLAQSSRVSAVRPLGPELAAATAITQGKSMEMLFGCIFNLAGCELSLAIHSFIHLPNTYPLATL